MKSTLLALSLLATLVCAAPVVAAGGKRMTTASAVRVRSTPSTTGSVVDTLAIGVVLDEIGRSDAPQRVGDRDDYWYKVGLAGGKQGWVFGGLTRAVDPSRLDDAYLQLARERVDNEIAALTFADWSDFVAMLDRVIGSVASRQAKGELELIRLVAIGDALASIPIDKQDAAPYKAFRGKLGDTIVYSEPGGQWLVVAEEFWKLQARYADTPLGERIAWDGASAQLPGECEGDLSCHLSAYNITTGRYLKLYPKGPHADEALGLLIDSLKQVANDDPNTGYYIPTEPEYMASMRKDLAETRTLVSATASPRRDEALALIDKVDARLK